VLSQQAMELLTLIGDAGVKRVVTTMGAEQEFFIIDRQHFAMRPDLVMSGRSLLGAPPPRGQQLEDHYFAGIPERVMACFADIEQDLYKLGVPIVTRHNEVAPCQFEMAPRFEDADIATDHNQLVMSIVKRVAMRHGLAALFHEKPFAGINGSGKHCNWSVSIVADNELDGVNLLKPGKTPHQNVRFLLFLAAVLRGVHKHQGLLRAAIASSGNEHRLGANEAPPAIISVFMGDTLTRVIEDIAAGKAGDQGAAQAMIKLGVAKLPEVAKDNTDRNRTSPFAFTGAKFEFRAVGGSASIAFPVMMLNAVVAEAIRDIIVALKAEMGRTKVIDDAIFAVVRQIFQETTAIRFEGNGYSQEWVEEAARRGLLNLRRSPEALAQLTTENARTLFTSLGILTAEELTARYNVRLERYIKDLLIEMHTLEQVAQTQVLPAAMGYLNELVTAAAHAKSVGLSVIPQLDAAQIVAPMVAELRSALDALRIAIDEAERLHDDAEACGQYVTSTGADSMARVRAACDGLEVRIDDARWPIPRYREILFPV
jgi:glutamine synthetase